MAHEPGVPSRADVAGPELLFNHDAELERGNFELSGLSPEAIRAIADHDLDDEAWRALFAVAVDLGGDAPSPPMMGDYSIAGDRIRFQPRFPIQTGLKFRAVFDPAALPPGADKAGLPERPIERVFSVPRSARGIPTRITAVYPSGAELPENLLKFYIHFDRPMSAGVSYRFIHLIKAGGERVELPFLELEQELWNEDQTRFTLLFDPGRIKRGLVPREEVGPALIEGEPYSLAIDTDWLDARGFPLGEEFLKTFRVVAPDDTPPDPKAWEVLPPKSGTAEALEIRFPDSMDRALLDRAISVRDPNGSVIEGSISVSRGERIWQFIPENAWSAGMHRLSILTILEDVAGNSIGRPFEVDTFERVGERIDSETVSLRFEVE